MEPPNGVVAGRYRLVRPIASGGMGAVWEGWDERLRRAVALKLLSDPPASPAEPPGVVTARAMREARIAARLEHRHAVSVYDVVEHEGRPCLVLQLVPSQPLSEVLTALTALDERETATLGAQVASALAAAHVKGIVHRDVKPGNILIADDGTAQITDFGIAHAVGDSTLTTTGMLTGTPAYLAPEVARGGESTYASDVFSLGATLYAALEGHPPFGQDPNAMALLHRVASGRVDPPQHAGALSPLLGRMLATDPAARPSMAEVAERLRRHTADPEAPVLTDGPVVAPAPGAGSGSDDGPDPVGDRSAVDLGRDAPPAPRRRRRGPLVLALVAAVLVAAAVVAVLGLLRPGATDDPGTAAPAPTSTATTGTTATTSPPSPATSAAPTPAAPTSAAPAPSAPASSTAAPSAAPTASATAPTGTASAAGGSSRAEQLAGAVSRYYTLVPGDLDTAFGLMTADYAQRVAGGRAAYGRFWAGFSSVTATDIAPAPPSGVTATITYTTTSGRVIRERTEFGLVDEGGVLKIGSSRVVSRSG